MFRNKFHSSINIFGLVIGFTIGICVLLAVYTQLSFDNFHANGKNIYQAYNVYFKEKGDEPSPLFGYPAAPAYKQGSPAIERASRFMFGGSACWYGDKELELPVMIVDKDFLSMFSFPVVKGSNSNLLSELGELVITESSAKKIFGNENPVGKTLRCGTKTNLLPLTVVAVLKDIPVNSSIRFDALARIENREGYAAEKSVWTQQHHNIFFQLNNNASASQVEMQLRDVNRKALPDWYASLENEKAKKDKNGDVFATKLLPLSKVHFSPQITGRGVAKAQIFVVLLAGLLIILIACFNFININLANAFTRAKEIGVRKCLGAGKTKLFAQLWGESFLLCAISFMLSLLLVNVLIYFVNNSFKVNMPLQTIMWQPGFLACGLALLLFTSLVAGGYPGWVMMRFKAAETLKGKISLKTGGLLRNSLIVAQFAIGCIMLSCTFIVYKQFVYLQNAKLGINTSYVISVPFHQSQAGKMKTEKLRMRLASNPDVVSVTGSNINIGLGLDKSSSKNSIGFGYKGKTINTNIANADYDYLKTFGIRPIEGKDFEKGQINDSAFNVIISESAAKQFEEKNMAGQQILVDSASPKWNIVGIIPDFHLYSLHEAREPVTLILSPKNDVSYCFVKVNGVNPLAAMEAVKKEMKMLEPGQEFEGTFVDENIRNWYNEERVMSILFAIAAAVSIVLSCLGLLAMVLLVLQQRMKEIGVRKVLGADVSSISVLMSKDFLKLVFIAVLTAIPIAWMAMNSWLKNFPYRVEISWWMFLLVAVAALVIAALTVSYNTIRAAMQNPVKYLRTE